MVEREKPSRCWSSLISPPLYGTNLLCCVLWDRITDLNYHYGVLEGRKGELEELMHCERAKIYYEKLSLKTVQNVVLLKTIILWKVCGAY